MPATRRPCLCAIGNPCAWHQACCQECPPKHCVGHPEQTAEERAAYIRERDARINRQMIAKDERQKNCQHRADVTSVSMQEGQSTVEFRCINCGKTGSTTVNLAEMKW